jgi:hypothetical protein
MDGVLADGLADGRRLYIPPDDNWISRSVLTRSLVNDN